VNVKPVPAVPSYQVNTANDTSDEKKGHSGKGQDKRKKKTAPANPSTSPSSAQETNADASLDLCQIVDSEKLLQLLALKPTERTSVVRSFGSKKVQASESVTDLSAPKKVNHRY
jgi:hypothetical protein